MPAVAAAYPLLDWSAVILKKKTSPSFKEELEQALAVFAKKASVSFQTSAYERHNVVGWLVEHELRFLPISDFERLCNCKPSDIDMATEALPIGPEGKMVNGVMVRDTSQPGVKIRAYQAVEGLLRTNVFPDSQEIRPGQAREVKEWYEADLARTLPKSVGAGATRQPVMHTLAELPQLTKDMLERVRQRKAKEIEMKAAREELTVVPEPQVSEDVPEQPEENSQEVVENVVASSSLVPPSALLSQKGKKRPGKDSKAAAAQPSKRIRLSAKTAVSDDAKSVAGGSVVSAAGSSGQAKAKAKKHVKQSPEEKHSVKAQEWMEVIDIVDILEGQSGRRHCFNAHQTLAALEKEAGGATAESILLKATLETAQLATDLLRVFCQETKTPHFSAEQRGALPRKFLSFDCLLQGGLLLS